MLDTPISWLLTIIAWLASGLSSIADFFSSLADSAAQIPLVGGFISSFFASIAWVFDVLADEVKSFGTWLEKILNTIDDFLDKVATLWTAVYGWLADKLTDAYSWATKAWNWIVDTGKELTRDVYGWIADKLDDAYSWATNAWEWVKDTGREAVNAVNGWITDKLHDAYSWANNAWDWVKDNAARVAALPELIKDMILGPIAPFINLVSLFFEDINAFFSDPADFADKKVEKGGVSLAERLWNIVEKILERIW